MHLDFLMLNFDGKCISQCPQSQKCLVIRGFNNPWGSGSGHTPRYDTKVSRGIAESEGFISNDMD